MSVPAIDPQGAALRSLRCARSRAWRDTARQAAVSSARQAELAADVAALKGSAATPVPGRPRPNRVLYARCLAGDEPAESLPTKERELLVAELFAAGWSDHEIADHTRMTLYTTARVRARLGLSPNRPGEAGT